MKKKLSLILALVAALALSATMLAGCGGNEEATETEAVEISEFVVGFDQNYPPYGYVGDDGEFTGFDLDLAKEVCERNGWTFVAEPIDWDAKDTLLNSDAITCIWNGFTIEGREADYAFSDPYMLNAQVIVVKADSDIAALADLEGKTVVTQTDSAAQGVLEGDQAELAGTFASLDTIGEYNTAFMQLESGAVDAVACDLSIAQYQMAAKEGAYVMLDEYLSSEHYGVGFKLGNEALRDQVNETLKEMVADGTVEELCAKYADMGLSYENWQIEA